MSKPDGPARASPPAADGLHRVLEAERGLASRLEAAREEARVRVAAAEARAEAVEREHQETTVAALHDLGRQIAADEERLLGELRRKAERRIQAMAQVTDDRIAALADLVIQRLLEDREP